MLTVVTIVIAWCALSIPLGLLVGRVLALSAAARCGGCE